jgi:hypothetical protein
VSIDEIRAEIEALGGVLVLAPEPGDGSPEISWGDLFFYYAPAGVLPPTQPFATVVTKEYPDEPGWGLDRPGAFRLNVAVGSAEFRRWTGRDPDQPNDSEADAVADDVVLPHPVYGHLGWLCVVNPGSRTASAVPELIGTAHDLARRRHDRRSAADRPHPDENEQEGHHG